MNNPTIEQLLKSSSAQLVNSDSALLDVQILLAHVLNVSRSHFYTWPDKVVESSNLNRFNDLLARRVDGEPIAYIIGQQEFWSLPFMVSPATLIPRADTEVLVETVLNKIDFGIAKGIDLGTGTGAIALSLAHDMPNWSMLAVDYSQEAVELARRNRINLSIDNVEIIQSDWLSDVDDSWLAACDFIVSNPPYIDEKDPHLSQGDVRFEPSSALIAANGGLQDYIDILDRVKPYLKQGGYVFFEHGFEQADALQQLFTECSFSNINTVKDYAGNDRVTFGQLI
ncbi:MAG: peptide chain release factor N(5)-glutamine methyltransferase [Psychrobium sp.]